MQPVHSLSAKHHDINRPHECRDEKEKVPEHFRSAQLRQTGDQHGADQDQHDPGPARRRKTFLEKRHTQNGNHCCHQPRNERCCIGCRSILQTTGGQQRIGNTCSGNQKHKAERTELAKAEPFHQNHRQQHQPRHAETQRNDVERRQCGLEPETGQDERTGPHENPGQPPGQTAYGIGSRACRGGFGNCRHGHSLQDEGRAQTIASLICASVTDKRDMRY